MDLIGFKPPVMIPDFPAYTSNGKKLAQLPSLEDIEHRDTALGFQPCKFGYYHKESISDQPVLPENLDVQFVEAPEPPETSGGIYPSCISRTNMNVA
jgi:hypothetical protein